MDETIQFLSSTSGIPIISSAACVIFLLMIFLALRRRRVSIGSLLPIIERSDNPRFYWFVIALFGFVALLTGVSTILSILSVIPTLNGR